VESRPVTTRTAICAAGSASIEAGTDDDLRARRGPNVETVLRLSLALNCKVSTLMSVFDETDLSSLLPNDPN
jgi:hypothetical protein